MELQRNMIGSLRWSVESFVQHLDRGRVIQTNDSWFVECKKHLRQMLVSFDSSLLSGNAYKYFDAIEDAFDTCPGCMDEKEWAKSRWPSGAEL